MDTPNTITIQLENREHEHLKAVAHRKGMTPDVLVRTLIDDALNDDVLNDPERGKQAMYDALDKLASTMPKSLFARDAMSLSSDQCTDGDRR